MLHFLLTRMYFLGSEPGPMVEQSISVSLSNLFYLPRGENMRLQVGHLLAAVVFALWLVACAGSSTAEEFTRSFQGNAYDPDDFKPTGKFREAMRIEPEGLRITLSPVHGSKKPVGLVRSTRIRGDFEITMEFEVLQVDRPTAGDAGLGVYIAMVSPTNEAASIGRLVRPKGENVFVTHRAYTPTGMKRIHYEKATRTEVGTGKLRLVRTDTTLHYLVAKGDSNLFEEIDNVPLESAEVDSVRFAANNGKSDTAVDVRIKHVSIRGDEADSVSASETRGWALWLAMCALVLVAGSVYWLWRRRSRSEN